MLNQFSRTAMQLGSENMERLHRSKVAIFGIGGVGGYSAESLCRTGIGTIDLYDDDCVCLTNLNRQLAALHSTVGQYKVDVMRARMLDINPAVKVGAFKVFYGRDNAGEIDLAGYDYILDAVDTMTAKLELACRANALGVPMISAMGAANKLDASGFRVSDINKTTMCPLARIMRKELRRRGVKRHKVVWSEEDPMVPLTQETDSCDDCRLCPPDAIAKRNARRQLPASNAFVPAVVGLIMAGEVVKDLLKLGAV